MEYVVDNKDELGADYALLKIMVEVVHEHFAIRNREGVNYVLDHIATGRRIITGSNARCRAMADSLATMPIDWGEVGEKLKANGDKMAFISRARDASYYGQSISWGDFNNQHSGDI